jgi:hypothetical protein
MDLVDVSSMCLSAFFHEARFLPVKSEMTNSTRNNTNNILAIVAAMDTSIPKKPKIPAITAKTKNKADPFSMFCILLQLYIMWHTHARQSAVAGDG